MDDGTEGMTEDKFERLYLTVALMNFLLDNYSSHILDAEFGDDATEDIFSMQGRKISITLTFDFNPALDEGISNFFQSFIDGIKKKEDFLTKERGRYVK